MHLDRPFRLCFSKRIVKDPDELIHWTDGQIEVEIASLISDEDVEFVVEWVEGAWSARLEKTSPGGEAVVLHASEHIDRRMALYEVYGYFWLKSHPPPIEGSLWDPSAGRPTREAVSKYVASRPRDPEDLDPDEVAAVYGVHHPPKKEE